MTADQREDYLTEAKVSRVREKTYATVFEDEEEATIQGIQSPGEAGKGEQMAFLPEPLEVA